MRWFYGLVLFFGGLSVLVIEISGTRLIAPYFGSGIYVWSALILVTMVGLALGYWRGGALADRRPHLTSLAWVLFLSGIATFLLPLLSKPLLGLLFGGPLVLMTLFSAFLLFTVPLFLLGMITPLTVRLKSEDKKPIGLTVGKIYAVSTLGSVAGALLAGFILIPLLGVKKLFFLTALPLLLIAFWGFLKAGDRRGRILTALACLLPLLGLFWPAPHPKPQFNYLNRPQVSLLASRDSQYANLKVIRVKTPLAVNLCLLMDGVMQTAVMKGQTIERGDSLRIGNKLELLPFFNPQARSCLLIGLGGGLQAKILGNYPLKIRAVEIDPGVVKLARYYFGCRAACAVADGRYYLLKHREKYDLIVLDALQGDSLANCLFSSEMYGLCRERLKPGGVLAVNSLGNPGKSPVSALIASTLGKEFPFVRAYRSLQADTPQIVTFFASASPLALKTGSWGVEPGLLAEAESFAFTPTQTGKIITDNYNPAAGEWAQLAYQWRGQNRNFFTPGVWDY